MGYGKRWKVHKSKILALYNNADTNDECDIEVWHDTSENVADCELFLLLAVGWEDEFDDVLAVDPTI